MLNQTSVTKTSGVTRKTILVDEQNSTAFSCVLTNTDVTEQDGKKIIKAGTPIHGDLTARNTPFTVAKTTTGTSNAVGVCTHDVDVTNGNANGGVIVFGFIDVSKLDSDVQAMITTEVKTALNMIKFVK